MLASTLPWVPALVAPCRPSVRRLKTRPGSALQHRFSGHGADRSPRVPLPLTTPMLWDSPPSPAQIFSSRGAGWIKIPYGLLPRFSSTAFLCRLRATKTLIRWTVSIESPLAVGDDELRDHQ
jgi:hypothetical protein